MVRRGEIKATHRHTHKRERCPRSAAVRRSGRECQFPAPNNDTWPVQWASSPVYRCDVKRNASVTKWLPNIGPFNLALWCVFILRTRPVPPKIWFIPLFLAWVCVFSSCLQEMEKHHIHSASPWLIARQCNLNPRKGWPLGKWVMYKIIIKTSRSAPCCDVTGMSYLCMRRTKTHDDGLPFTRVHAQ